MGGVATSKFLGRAAVYTLSGEPTNAVKCTLPLIALLATRTMLVITHMETSDKLKLWQW